MRDLAIHKTVLYSAQARLRDAGVIRFAKFQRALWVLAEAFER